MMTIKHWKGGDYERITAGEFVFDVRLVHARTKASPHNPDFQPMQHWTVDVFPVVEGEAHVEGVRFDFWNSWYQTIQGEPLRALDALTTFARDACLPHDPDELMEELGPMPVRQALASCRWSERAAEVIEGAGWDRYDVANALQELEA